MACGQDRLNTGRKKGIKGPVSASQLPRHLDSMLNVEMDIKLKMNAATNDQAVYDQQVYITKAAILLLRAIDKT